MQEYAVTQCAYNFALQYRACQQLKWAECRHSIFVRNALADW